MTRRQLLAGAMAGAASGSAATPTIRLEIGNYGMQSMTVDQSLATIREIGFDGAELCCMPDWPSEPKKLEVSIAGSGHVTHPDGTRQDRHSRDRHARLEQDDFGAIVDDAVTRGGPPDPDELDRAKAKLKARIRHQVAQALAGEDEP